ncbi:MAG: 5-formyltetrahydrofolate cyclo-ligase [Sphingobium sp.]|nr:5-formyltetrahydrofolate cyclo-ligase [Sphingobium sp.]
MIADEKAALRARLRAARLGFAGPPLRVPTALQVRLARPGVMASYLPIAGEIDPAPITDAALAIGWQLALPHVTARDRPMRFLGWTPGEPLIGGPFGLRQPADNAREVAPDLILTPLVAFDTALNRLGQGAGYYDRAFAALPDAMRIGIAWSAQQVPKVPVDDWDIPLHAVLTEQQWIGPDIL